MFHLCQSMPTVKNTYSFFASQSRHESITGWDSKLKYKQKNDEKGANYRESFRNAIEKLEDVLYGRFSVMGVWKLDEPTLRPDGSIDTSAYEPRTEVRFRIYPQKGVSAGDQMPDGKNRDLWNRQQ